MQHPLKVGQVCVFQCHDDQQFYRVRIERVSKNNNYKFFYIDHGLYEERENPIFLKATPKLLTYNDLASYCKLAYIRLPNKGHPMYESAMKFLTDLLDTVNSFTIVDEDDSAYHVIVNEKDSESLNHTLVQKGLALTKNLPLSYKSWAEAEFEAKSEQLGIWENGGAIEDDEI